MKTGSILAEANNEALAYEFFRVLRNSLELHGKDVRLWVRKTEVTEWDMWDTVTRRELYLTEVRYSRLLVRLLYFPLEGWLCDLPFIARVVKGEGEAIERIEIGDPAVLPKARELMCLLRALPRHADARVLLTTSKNPQKDIADE